MTLVLLPQTRQWRCYRAGREFAHQALLQNGVDGVNREQAFWYQHEVADMMLLAGLTARANELRLRAGVLATIESMLVCIARCMDRDGDVPAFGDADDGVVVRFSPIPDLNVYRSLLASGSVLFQRGDFRYKAQLFDDKSRWLLGDAAAERFEQLAPDATERSLPRAFRQGGYYVLAATDSAAQRGAL